jgi:SAM-dependent methyltransferase
MAKARKTEKSKGRKGEKGRRKRPKMADKADRFELYQQSVQCPEAEIEFINKVFRKERRRKPLTFREDFCGTAFLATGWAKSNKRRTAIAVDLDAPTLTYARDKVLAKEKTKVRDRVELIHANVLDVTSPKVDVGCALNFSYCVFKDRKVLTQYFRAACEGLVDDGIFFCELYGGTEAISVMEEEREVDGFTYVWDQADYNPITNETLCHIHFRFPDGSRIKKAFTYDWRLWTIPEVRESLLEAGFSRVDVYWDPVEDEDEDGDYRITEKEDNQECWLVYFVALK